MAATFPRLSKDKRIFKPYEIDSSVPPGMESALAIRGISPKQSVQSLLG